MANIDHVPQIVQKIYESVGELEKLFPGRHFTPDGHLVGSIGEVLAAHRYGLTLLPASSAGHDAISPSGKCVQVKATHGNSVGIRSECDHLIVLRISQDGSFDEVYNGPGDMPWDAAGRMQKNGQRAISLGRLRELMLRVPLDARLPAISP